MLGFLMFSGDQKETLQRKVLIQIYLVSLLLTLKALSNIHRSSLVVLLITLSLYLTVR